jgi:hypothetical protein
MIGKIFVVPEPHFIQKLRRSIIAFNSNQHPVDITPILVKPSSGLQKL